MLTRLSHKSFFEKCYQIKFRFHLLHSVSIASRYEASGHPDKIHITEAVKNTLGDDFIFQDCGEVMIKGKGMMRSYFLTGKNLFWGA